MNTSLKVHPRSQRQGPLRKIVSIKYPDVTSNDPLYRPIKILACGHEVRTDGKEYARCDKCATEPPKQGRMKVLSGHATNNCPLQLDVCYGSCHYWSQLQSRCSWPVSGATVDANLSGDRDGSGEFD